METIQLVHVSKKQPWGRICPEDVSFSLYPGELVLITGGNGAGKSSLLKILSLLELPTSGTMVLLGHDIGSLTYANLNKVKASVEYIPQKDFGLIKGSALSNVTDRLLRNGENQKNARNLAQLALQQVQTVKGFDIHKDISKLSGGEQARVAIASALACKHPLCLADEIFADVDKNSYIPLLQLFRQLCNNGCTVVMISHVPGLDMYYDRIITMDNCRVVADTGPKAIPPLQNVILPVRQQPKKKIPQTAKQPHTRIKWVSLLCVIFVLLVGLTGSFVYRIVVSGHPGIPIKHVSASHDKTVLSPTNAPVTPTVSPTPTIVSIIINVSWPGNDDKNITGNGDGSLTIHNIDLPYAGSYHVTLSYSLLPEDDKFCYMSINSGKTQRISLPQTGIGRKATVTKQFNMGNNDITISSPPYMLYQGHDWLNYVEITDLNTPIV